jgi:hypothetical protein
VTRGRAAHALLGVATLMDVVPLSMCALHLAGAMRR